MLQRLRQDSKTKWTLPILSRPKFDPQATGFMSLPGEIRNVIYELAVQDTSLTLVPLKVKTRHPPALLMVSKQVRAEFRPFLLTQATIVAHVSNYNFKTVKSVAASMHSRDVKLLRQNKRMVIKLHCSRIHSKDIDSLRRWLVYRNDPLDRLPWSYDVDESVYKNRRLLVEHVSELHEMQKQLDERLLFELQPINNAVSDALVWLGKMNLLAAEEARERRRDRRGSAGTS